MEGQSRARNYLMFHELMMEINENNICKHLCQIISLVLAAKTFLVPKKYFPVGTHVSCLR